MAKFNNDHGMINVAYILSGDNAVPDGYSIAGDCKNGHGADYGGKTLRNKTGACILCKREYQRKHAAKKANPDSAKIMRDARDHCMAASRHDDLDVDDLNYWFFGE